MFSQNYFLLNDISMLICFYSHIFVEKCHFHFVLHFLQMLEMAAMDRHTF